MRPPEPEQGRVTILTLPLNVLRSSDWTELRGPGTENQLDQPSAAEILCNDPRRLVESPKSLTHIMVGRMPGSSKIEC